jgi:hypothetical protein
VTTGETTMAVSPDAVETLWISNLRPRRQVTSPPVGHVTTTVCAAARITPVIVV